MLNIDNEYNKYVIGGGIDAFYRSKMNILINKRITQCNNTIQYGPKMYFQMPVRITYILGYKYISLNSGIDNKYYNSIFTGMLMTPFSSILEACHTNNGNKMQIIMYSRHGSLFRLLREISFSYGLNFTTDNNSSYYLTSNYIIHSVFATYISHIPHILSTQKLFTPNVSYYKILNQYISNGNKLHKILIPNGIFLRTIQILGSYIIINSVGNYIYSRIKLLYSSNTIK